MVHPTRRALDARLNGVDCAPAEAGGVADSFAFALQIQYTFTERFVTMGRQSFNVL
jgi:hypothetical protein